MGSSVAAEMLPKFSHHWGSGSPYSFAVAMTIAVTSSISCSRQMPSRSKNARSPRAIAIATYSTAQP
jgi:hypothetical protein